MEYAKIGFIGCGTHSTNNLYPMLKYARCRLQAVCDKDKALAERNARVFGGRAVYTDADAMLDSENLDGVMIVGPPQMHYDLGRKVLERGIPLFVEKPPASNLASARELADLAAERGTIFMVGFMKRFALTYKRIRDFAAQGRFDPSCGFFRYMHWANTNLEPMLLFMAIHPIDLAISFFGEVAEVASATYNGGRALCLALTLRFTSGKWAQLMLGCHGPRIQEHVEISGVMDGKDGCFVVDDIIQMELHTAGRSGVDLTPSLPEIAPTFDLDDIKVWRPDFGLPNMGQNSPFLCGYAGEIREFVDAILDKRQPTPGGEECLAAMQVIDAILKKPDGTTKLSS